MGNDLSAYRARIGRFSPRTKLKSKSRLCCGYVLPRCCYPRASLILAVVATSLLLCSGDVELNPGPDKLDDILAKLDALGSQNTKFQSETREQLSDIAHKIDGLTERVAILEAAAKGYDEIKSSVQESSTKINSLQDAVALLSGSLDELENRSRRNNLIIKGIAEGNERTWNDTEKTVRDFFRSELRIEVGEIERTHRLGRQREGFDRPIIVRFLNFKSKQQIFSNASKLKERNSETKVWFEDDYSTRMRGIRKRLWEFGKVHHQQGKKVRLNYDKLSVDKQTYIYDPASDTVVLHEAVPSDTAQASSPK